MLQELILRYHRHAETVRRLLEDLSGRIATEGEPGQDMPEQLRLALTELQLAYTAVRNRAGELVSEDELPAPGAPVTAYQTAVEGSVRLQYTATLADFLRVSTTHARYAGALEQAQARASSLQESTALSAEAVSPYCTFD